MPDFSRSYWKWIILAGCVLYCALEASGTGDLFIYLSAAADLGHGIDIFEKKYVDGYHYFYSVLFALILKPLAYLPYTGVRFSWMFFNSLLFFHLLRLLYYSNPSQVLEKNKRNVFVLLVFIASLRFFTDNIHTSQVSILILWCCLYGLHLVFHERTFAGAFLLALGINIKLLPLVIVPYLIYRGKWKSTIYIAVIYVLMLFLPSLIIGHDENMNLLSTWLKLINPSNKEHILDVEERSFHGLSTLLSTLLIENVPDMYALPLKRNIADISLENLSRIILSARLLLITLTLFFLRTLPFRSVLSARHAFFEISYILLIIPLIFPHQQHYAFLFAMPAFTLLLYEAMRSGFSKYTGLFLAFIYLAFNLKLLLGAYNEYYDHYKILTYAALSLVPALMFAFRKTVKEVR